MKVKLFIGDHDDLCVIKVVPFVKPGLLVSMAKPFSEYGLPYRFEIELDETEVI